MVDLPADVRLFILNRDGEALLELGGDLDVLVRDAVRDHLHLLVDGGTAHVRVDMAAVTFCEAATAALLADTRQRVHAEGGHLQVVAASPIVERVLHALELDDLLGGVQSPREHRTSSTALPRVAKRPIRCGHDRPT